MARPGKAKDWDLTPAADGRRYSKYPAGDVGFLVSADAVFDTTGVADPAYRIKPPGGAWGDWIAGKQFGQAGTATTVSGAPLPGPFEFTTTQNVALNTLTESNVITISAEGHELQIRRKSAVADYNSARSLDAIVNGVSTRWLLWTEEEVITPTPPAPGVVPSPTSTAQFTAGETFIAASTVGPINLSGVAPGSIVTLHGGAKHQTNISENVLRIENLQGTAANPILLRNNPASSGPVVMTRDGENGNLLFRMNNCRHVIVDGLFKWAGAPTDEITYGIRVEGNPATRQGTCFFMSRESTDIKIRGVECDGKWNLLNDPVRGAGTGIQYAQDTARDPWRFRNLLIEYCYLHHLRGEGMYLGNNWSDAGSNQNVRMENSVVRHNRIEYVALDLCEFKSHLFGVNSYHDNYGFGFGMHGTDGNVQTWQPGFQNYGVSLYQCAATFNIYNNWIEQGGGPGIFLYNDAPDSAIAHTASNVKAYNNVVFNVCRATETNGANRPAVHCGNSSGKIVPKIDAHHNTLVQGVGGIHINTGSSAYDNIVAGFSGTSFGGTQYNNPPGTIPDQHFVSSAAKNFRLTINSPARNSGSASGYPATDYDGVSRPQEGTVDRGAFEFEGV